MKTDWETKEVAFGVSPGHFQCMTAVAHTSGVKSVLSFLSFSEVVYVQIDLELQSFREPYGNLWGNGEKNTERMSK